MKINGILLIIILVCSIFVVIPNQVQAVHIPPTRAYPHVESRNGTLISAVTYNDTIHLNNGSGIILTFYPNNSTILISLAPQNTTGLTNATNLSGTFHVFKDILNKILEFRGIDLGTGLSGVQNSTSIILQINFKVNGYTCPIGSHAFSFSNSTGQTTCTIDAAGSGSTFDTLQNVGGGQGSIYAGNSTNTNFQIKTLVNSTGIKITNGTTTLTLATNFKVFSQVCGGTQFIQSFNNVTGLFTCVNDGGITSASGQNNGNGIKVYTGNSGNSILLFNTLRSGYGLVWSANTTDDQISLNFKVNNSTCTAGQFQNGFSNKTGNPTCATPSGTGVNNAANIGHGGKGLFKDVTSSTINLRNITSLTPLLTVAQNLTDVNINSAFKSNTITCSNQFLSAFNNVTGLFTCSSAIININGKTGPNITIDNYTINSQNGPSYTIQKGTSSNVKVTTMTNTVSIDANNTAQLANSDNGETLIGVRENATKNDIKTLRNGTGISLPHNSTSITVTNTGVTSLSCVSGNTTCSSSTGAITLNTGTNVVVTNGAYQTFSKHISQYQTINFNSTTNRLLNKATGSSTQPMFCGCSVQITPAFSDNATITLISEVSSTTSGFADQVRLICKTGSPPHQLAVWDGTGSVIGPVQHVQIATTGLAYQVVMTGYITGLSAGVSEWCDLAQTRSSAGSPVAWGNSTGWMQEN